MTNRARRGSKGPRPSIRTVDYTEIVLVRAPNGDIIGSARLQGEARMDALSHWRWDASLTDHNFTLSRLTETETIELVFADGVVTTARLENLELRRRSEAFNLVGIGTPPRIDEEDLN
ncbi:MAG: hypothetical protein QF652_04865 [Dehalococcoidia bacterium]|nr:hypothetical protein [Dehalococcoidia bacterium]